jgi:hypothetical protein
MMLRAIGFSAPIWYLPHPTLGWTLRPGISAWFTQEGRAYVQINAEGRRDSGATKEKQEDTYRIAVLGDSYTEAMQVPVDQSYWALLPAHLQACGYAPGKRIEVLNFGVSGYGTAQEYLTLELSALRYSPDLVLLQFTNGNDLKDNSILLDEDRSRPFFRLEHGTLKQDASSERTAAFLKRNSALSRYGRWLSDHSRLVQLARLIRKGAVLPAAQAVEAGLDTEPLVPPKDPVWEGAWQLTEALIVRTALTAREHGAHFVLFNVPYAVQVHPDAGLRKGLEKQLGVKDLFYPDRRLAELAKTNKLAYVPLAYAMQQHAERSAKPLHGFGGPRAGFGHWNPAGHDLAARLLAGHLCKTR